MTCFFIVVHQKRVKARYGANNQFISARKDNKCFRISKGYQKTRFIPYVKAFFQNVFTFAIGRLHVLKRRREEKAFCPEIHPSRTTNFSKKLFTL